MGQSQAFIYGQKDGQMWDLSGFPNVQAIRNAKEVWADATVRVMGVRYCETLWGVSISDADAWEQACNDYNRGCYEAVVSRFEKI